MSTPAGDGGAVAGPLTAAERALRAAYGEPEARASVMFVGAERIEVLRFAGDGGLVRYATLGMAAEPSARGPAELVLTLRAGRAATDGVLRPLAVLAASPQVEGAVVAPGASFDLGEPLWPEAPFTSVLIGEPDAAAAPVGADGGVLLLPVLPMTAAEAAWKRARGAQALRERWRRHGTDLTDPLRRAVPLAE